MRQIWKKVTVSEKKKLKQYQTQTLVSGSDTKTEFRSHTTLQHKPLMKLLPDNFLLKRNFVQGLSYITIAWLSEGL